VTITARSMAKAARATVWAEALRRIVSINEVRDGSGANGRDEKIVSHDDMIKEAVSRHPPRARISGAAGSHGEAVALRPCLHRLSQGAGAIPLTESFAMMPASSVQRLLPSPARSEIYSLLARSRSDQVEVLFPRPWGMRGEKKSIDGMASESKFIKSKSEQVACSGNGISICPDPETN
jgi:hypothetical protein